MLTGYFLLFAFLICASTSDKLHNPVKGSLSLKHSERFLKQGPANNYTYRSEFFDTYLDHFNFANDQKFKVKYLINEDHFQPGGAIFFYTGNEGLIESFADNTGIMWNKAPEFNATLIFMEHRYYGESKPFGDKSYTNRSLFAYFTAEQALADYASFLDDLKRNNPKYTHAPVIAFGGSYGGMLAAWFRQKYPNLVTGSLAASAPVLGFPGMTKCGAFFEVLTKAFERTGSKNCVAAIRKSWNILQFAKPDELVKSFKLCKAVPSGMVLSDYLNEFYGEIGMVNYPYPASFLDDYPAWPVTEFCKPFANQNVENLSDVQLLDLLAEGLYNNKNYTGKLQCLDLSSGPAGLDTNGWYLQTCTEMQLPMCSDSVSDMFPPTSYDPVQTAQECASSFDGVTPRLNWPNIQFWGKNLPSSLDRIIYSNGALDPWSPMGVLEPSMAPGCLVLNIKNGAHHLDLREPNPLDPMDVRLARAQEWNAIQSWIDWHYVELYKKFNDDVY